MPTHREMGFEIFEHREHDVIGIHFLADETVGSLSVENTRNLAEALLALIRTRLEPPKPHLSLVTEKESETYKAAIQAARLQLQELIEDDHCEGNNEDIERFDSQVLSILDGRTIFPTVADTIFRTLVMDADQGFMHSMVVYEAAKLLIGHNAETRRVKHLDEMQTSTLLAAIRDRPRHHRDHPAFKVMSEKIDTLASQYSDGVPDKQLVLEVANRYKIGGLHTDHINELCLRAWTRCTKNELNAEYGKHGNQ